MDYIDYLINLSVQDEEGYKTSAWTHGSVCFWKHKEARKLKGIHEIVGADQLNPADQATLHLASQADCSAGDAPRPVQ